MLDRLARQEQASSDLGIGEPFTKESEYLLLTPGQPSDVLRPGPCRLHAEIAHQRGGCVRVAAGSQILKGCQCHPRLSPRHLTVAAPEDLGEQQPRLRGAVR